MTFDQIIAPTVYRHPIDQILCSLKYAGRLQWARTAAGLIIDCVLQQDLDLPQLLLPVPMTRKAIGTGAASISQRTLPAWWVGS